MEFTQEAIDALSVNEVAILKKVAAELKIQSSQVSAVVSLVAEGCTIPFISRYRKERHGSLDEVQVRDCDHLFKSYQNLETRRLEIIKGIFAQGKLSEGIYNNAMNAQTLVELEDLWAPFKKKKKTRGMLAIERGLEPLADLMEKAAKAAVEAAAPAYVKSDAENAELSVGSPEEAIQGAMDIIAERVAQDPENRADVREYYMKSGQFVVTGVGDEAAQKTSVYQMYWDYKEPLNQIKPHRILAINRGERDKALDVKIDVDVDGAIERLERKYAIANDWHKEAVSDGVVRLLSPAVAREIRSDLSEQADDHGIGVFSENLKNLLMQQPIKGTRILGVDPGIRTGTKCAALDSTGKYLGNFVIYNHKVAEAEAAILKAIKDYDVQLVAIGNGTGTREVQEIVAKVISEHCPSVLYTVVDEDGASVYSASDIAREEFPELDLTIRGAISIGRRLQDPLAELVKIDPKSIGVGLYQHDVNQKKLSETLDEVVGSVVNNVGVNLNTASFSLLKYVSGINGALAKKIVAYRDSTGKILSREDLMKVPGMGPKSFEQCAGFIKIAESADPLDNSWVHPENYSAARVVYELVQSKSEVTHETRTELKAKYEIGDQTISDIIEELKKPNRDPREGYPKPIMQKGVLSFEDLKEGMTVTGKIKNVVDFGAFVDIGLKETALLHLSEMSDHFVKDPMEVVKVGDVKECRIIGLDPDRRRISLSCKSASSSGQRGGHGEGGARQDGARSEGARRVVVARKAGDAASSSGSPHGPASRDGRDNRPSSGGQNRGGYQGGQRQGGSSRDREDDGMTYNPFAALLKDRK
ncbi:MAG TPA: Tex family protein [Treponemataceae bacterium]|nr:Tex family protein [Treponemataceae bacterium]